MVWLLVLTLAIDLAAVQREPNLEKRSDLALQAAQSFVGGARTAYQEGRFDQSKAELAQVKEAVELSQTSLKATGKNPRKNSKFFKRAEQATRDILRKLTGMRQAMDSSDHAIIDPVISEINEIHDELLHGIMTGGQR